MIYLLRHGETEWNWIGRIQGHGDSPLTTSGIAQARTNGERLVSLLEGTEACRMIASPLRCWRQTAFLIAEALGVDPKGITFEPRLRERGYGQWEGLTNAEAAIRFPDI